MLTIENSNKASGKLKLLKRILISISSFISLVVIFVVGWSISEVKSQNPFIPQNVVSKTVSKTIESFSHFRFPIKRVMGFNSDFPTFNLDIKLKNYAVLEKISDDDGNAFASMMIGEGLDPALPRRPKARARRPLLLL